MIKTIVFDGGLGNQMFQYAFYLQLKKWHPHDHFLFDTTKTKDCHNGFEIDKMFHVDGRRERRDYQRLKRLCPRFLKSFHTIKQTNSLEYDPSLLDSSYSLSAFEGFWQSEKYFESIANEVREAFAFRKDLLNEPTGELAKKLQNANCVSVHVRRGDYLLLDDYLGLCSIEYYFHALEYVKKNLDNPLFVFFSDDMSWVKEYLPVEDAIYVDWNQGENSWQDMYLMSQCKHNIIANSSFSWWGAWLNSNKDKMVVAPSKWFVFSPNYDILPEKWLVI